MCCFCVSFRGGSYFGASAQMILGCILTVKYTYTLAAAEIKLDDTARISTIGVFLTYGFLLFGFGAFIFRGIEMNCLRTLKVSVGGFLFLQSIILLIHFMLIVVAYEKLPEHEKKLQVAILIFNLIFSFVYLSTLFMYMVRLAQQEFLRSDRSSNGSENTLTQSSPCSSRSPNGAQNGPCGKLMGPSGRSSFNSAKPLPPLKINTLPKHNSNNNIYSSAGRGNFGIAQHYREGRWEPLNPPHV